MSSKSNSGMHRSPKMRFDCDARLLDLQLSLMVLPPPQKHSGGQIKAVRLCQVSGLCLSAEIGTKSCFEALMAPINGPDQPA